MEGGVPCQQTFSPGAVNGTCPWITVTKVFPRRTLLLLLTTAPKPIAVALEVRFPTNTLAPNPMAVLGLFAAGSRAHEAAPSTPCLSACFASARAIEDGWLYFC